MNYSINLDNKIVQFTEDELCQIYNSLNNWKWDNLLGEKPEGWDELPRYHRSSIKRIFCKSKDKIIGPINEQIEKRVGMKKLLEWHWIHNLGRTKEEYETWLFKKMADKFLRI